MIKILKTFGMTGKRAADIIGIAEVTFRVKKRNNSFTEYDYRKLTEFIKKEAQKL